MRVESADDRRTRRAVVTPRGRMMGGRIDAARERMFRSIFSDWAPEEVSELTRLMGEVCRRDAEWAVKSSQMRLR